MSSLRATSDPVRKITSNIKDASNKHIDPRTGHIQQGPSQMGFQSTQNVYVKESSHMESSSKNAFIAPRSENNQSFKGSKEGMVNGRNNLPSTSDRIKNEASASKHLTTYQSNNEIFPIQPIMDSGYGSLDKLKADGNSQFRSPVLIRRLSNKTLKHNLEMKLNGNSFDSDDVVIDERGSSGFVNIIGVTSSSMKDTAYDFVRKKK